jgi:hypothetical protein
MMRGQATFPTLVQHHSLCCDVLPCFPRCVAQRAARAWSSGRMKAYSLLGPPGLTRQLAPCTTRIPFYRSAMCRPLQSKTATGLGAAVCSRSSSSARCSLVPRAAASAADADLDGDPELLKTESSPGPRLQPTERVLKLWRKANAVCFDVDCKCCSGTAVGFAAPARIWHSRHKCLWFKPIRSENRQHMSFGSLVCWRCQQQDRLHYWWLARYRTYGSDTGLRAQHGSQSANYHGPSGLVNFKALLVVFVCTSSPFMSCRHYHCE